MSSSSSRAKAEVKEVVKKQPAVEPEKVPRGDREDDAVWVQCDKCSKWRALPASVNQKDLPEVWSCDMNKYDSNRNTCEALEESFSENEPLKGFFKLWTKRLRSLDKSEARLPPSAVTRGRKRRLEIEWIQCSNPSCGKWRAISLRGLDTTSMLRRLNRSRGGGWGPKKVEWFCSMNSWDETKASCTVPQEPLYDCMWNL